MADASVWWTCWWGLLQFAYCSPPSRPVPGMAGHIRFGRQLGDKGRSVHRLREHPVWGSGGFRRPATLIPTRSAMSSR